jgi:periplasmic divalent cation tolerance protein
MKLLCVYSTFGTAEEAKTISRILVEKKLAACANIFSAHTAIYVWENKLNENPETAVLFKTTSDRVHDLIREIKTLHSYDEPGITTWTIDGGSESFLNWIVTQTNR